MGGARLFSSVPRAAREELLRGRVVGPFVPPVGFVCPNWGDCRV